MGTEEGNVKGSCTDNIYTSSDAVEGSGVLDWNFSDHLVVMAKRKRKKVPATK